MLTIEFGTDNALIGQSVNVNGTDYSYSSTASTSDDDYQNSEYSIDLKWKTDYSGNINFVITCTSSSKIGEFLF